MFRTDGVRLILLGRVYVANGASLPTIDAEAAITDGCFSVLSEFIVGVGLSLARVDSADVVRGPTAVNHKVRLQSNVE
jgi:hypothetical protein